MVLFLRLTTGSSATAAFFLTMVKLIPHSKGLIFRVINICYFVRTYIRKFFLSLFRMPDRNVGASAVAYGLERMNREVSQWMRGHSEDDSSPHVPFIATRGYDSVVWNRLYSRDVSDLEDYQISQASISKETECYDEYVIYG